MKYLKILALVILYTQSMVVSIAQTQDKDPTTEESVQGLKDAETELNNVFNQVLKMYKSEAVFIKNIKEAQELWTKFRAAELKAKFPGSPGEYGSVYQMCVNDYLTELTHQRIIRLKTWIKGTYQGDVCSGSVRINE
jgi:uncharacterized protein YecT (DUF1311 family)